MGRSQQNVVTCQRLRLQLGRASLIDGFCDTYADSPRCAWHMGNSLPKADGSGCLVDVEVAGLGRSLSVAAGIPPIHFGVHEIRTGSTDGARADFEKMLAQLASATNPNVRMIAANPGDWGIDAFAGDLEGAVTVWQSKYFMPTTTTNHSQQIRESLASGLKAAAAIGYTIERWILCIPSSMDGPAAHWWDGWKKRQEKTHDITVELWDETELVRRLQSPTGDQVRRAYYEPFTTPAASTDLREAFRQDGHAPPEGTTALLPQASGLPGENPGLQPEAIGPYATPSAADNESGPGTLIDQWTPYDLEVHPAGPAMSRARSGPQQQILPGYVRREHDHVIAEAVNAAVAGQSRMVVLVGSSSTGKTRACWEAAGVTSTSRSRPRQSVTRCRLRPLTFFPPS